MVEQVGCRVDCAVPDLSGIDASSRGSRLFANFGGAVATKSSSPFEPLESLLFRDETKILDIGEYILTEIPFKECYSEDEVNMVSYRPDAFLEDRQKGEYKK